jgi:hypothetical protein
MRGFNRSARAYGSDTSAKTHSPDEKTDLVLFDFPFGIVFKVTVSLEPALDQLPKLFREAGVVQVVDSQTGSRSLARVSWSDTSLGRSDGRTTEFDLLETVNDLVEAHDQVSSVRDEQSTGAVEALSLDGIEFLKHGRRVDDETGSDKGDTLGVDQAGRQGVESVLHPLAGFLVVDNDGVAGVVSTSTSRTDIGFGSENVGELAFSFVTPLGSEAVVRR